MMSQKYGGEEFCIQSKGLELAAYEPRQAVGQGLGYAVSNRGGCHINAGYMVILEGLGLNINNTTTRGKAAWTMTFQNLMEAVSAAGCCIFTTYAFFPAPLIAKPNSLLTRMANKLFPFLGTALKLTAKAPQLLAVNLKPMLPHPIALTYATGNKMNFGKMVLIGERGYNLERLINARLGVSAKDDTLPARLTNTPQDTNKPNTKVPLEKLKKEYYKARGWNQDGLPTAKLIKKLGLDYRKVMVKVLIFGILRLQTGLSTIELDAQAAHNAGAALSLLRTNYPELKDIDFKSYAVFKNGKNIYGKLKTPLMSGDELAVLSPVSGG
jgi:aldehyde:ferredoxin oxidoreductase